MISLRSSRRRGVLWLALVSTVALIGACGGSGTGRHSPVEVELESMTGSLTSIAEQLGERPLLVSMWAVWCQPCRRELPELEKLAGRDAGVDVLAVNVGDDPQRINEYLTEMSLDIPVAIDPVGELLTALDVGTVPATILFDSDGAILWSHLGEVSAEQVTTALKTFVPIS